MKPHFNFLKESNELNCNLNEAQWITIEAVCQLLAPFAEMQKLLEGEKYITGSIVCLMVATGRSHLRRTISNADAGTPIYTLASKMLIDYNSRWGEGENVFTENDTSAARNRQKGIPLKLLQACVLDPRFKFIPGVSNFDRTAIWKSVHESCIAMDEDNPSNNPYVVPPEPVVPQNLNLALNLLDEASEQAALVPVHVAPPLSIEYQLQAYRAIPALGFRNDDFNPLQWWKEHESEFPTLAKLARRLLHIPATSAPSERVFSVVGITIVKCRARMCKENAADAIFLREVLPQVEVEERQLC